jgi:RES domain-containing protein
VTVNRICSARYPKNDGEGANLHGGRWNHKGTPMLYCAGTTSLCALEVLAHSAALPKGMVLITAEVPDELTIEVLKDADLPPDWNASMQPTSTKEFGSWWAAKRRTPILSVPSTIVRHERNFLINPLHIDFSKIKFNAPVRFVFDPRLK